MEIELDQKITELINEAKKQMAAIWSSVEAIKKVELAKLNEKYVGKVVKIKGQKGWNKGVVSSVWIPSREYISLKGLSENCLTPYVEITISSSGGAERRIFAEHLELASEEEEKDFYKTKEMHERINRRA